MLTLLTGQGTRRAGGWVFQMSLITEKEGRGWSPCCWQSLTKEEVDQDTLKYKWHNLWAVPYDDVKLRFGKGVELAWDVCYTSDNQSCLQNSLRSIASLWKHCTFLLLSWDKPGGFLFWQIKVISPLNICMSMPCAHNPCLDLTSNVGSFGSVTTPIFELLD